MRSTQEASSPPNTATTSSSPSTARGTARRKIGYRVARVVVEGGRVTKHEVFAEAAAGRIGLGRPVDLEIMPDGSLLVSDDHAG